MEFMTWSEIMVLIIEQFGGFIVCMISSFIFVYCLLTLLSPNIEISPFISKQIVDEHPTWVFKIINKSMFHAYNVKFHLSRRVPIVVENNKVNHRSFKVDLIKEELFCIPRYKKNKEEADFAALIRTDFDISTDIGTDNLEYELLVSVTHGLSNITKVTSQRFNSNTDIHSKGFKFGKSLKIIT